MIRKYFLRSSSFFSAVAFVFPTTNAFAENLYGNSIDKLVDANESAYTRKVNLPF